jgi:hypothetical protein
LVRSEREETVDGLKICRLVDRVKISRLCFGVAERMRRLAAKKRYLGS